MDDKVIARLKKILALANDSAASDAERETAMRHAHAYLIKHNLSMKDVVGAGEGEGGEERVKSMRKISPHAWARNVAFGIAQLFFCEYFFSRVRNSQEIHHYFVGLESNVATAQEMSVWLVKSIEREARQRVKEVWTNSKGQWERDFCKGAATAIYNRCKAMIAEAEESGVDLDGDGAGATVGTALVIAGHYATESAANKAIIKADGLELQYKADRQKRATASGFNAGHAYGSSVSLNKQISG